MNSHSSKKGFTLIEILVVIVIIVLLASMAIASYATFTRNARDTKRIADIAKISNALEQYKSNNLDGLYAGLYSDAPISYTYDLINQVQPNFKNYIRDMPQDPKPSASCSNYLYSVSADGKRYTVFTTLENSTLKEAVAVKTTPNALPVGTLTSTTFLVKSGACVGQIFNYWSNNP